MESGELFAWGNNARAQVPNGWGEDGKTKTEIPKTTPYRVTGRSEFSGRKIKQISLEYNAVVALDDKGTVWVWGGSGGYKLANGETAPTHQYYAHDNDCPTPRAVFGYGAEYCSNKRAHYIMTSADNSVVVLTTDQRTLWLGQQLCRVLSQQRRLSVSASDLCKRNGKRNHFGSACYQQ